MSKSKKSNKSSARQSIHQVEDVITQFLGHFANDNKSLFAPYMSDSDDAIRRRFLKMSYDERRALVAKTLAGMEDAIPSI